MMLTAKEIRGRAAAFARKRGGAKRGIADNLLRLYKEKAEDNE